MARGIVDQTLGQQLRSLCHAGARRTKIFICSASDERAARAPRAIAPTQERGRSGRGRALNHHLRGRTQHKLGSELKGKGPISACTTLTMPMRVKISPR